MKRNIKWWVKCVVHNMLVHPILPLADIVSSIGMKRLPSLIYWIHDNSAPVGGG